jgi:predicted dehydrogenase
MPQSRFSRRSLLKHSATAAAVCTFVPKTAFGANERIHVGCVGVGGKGRSDVSGAAGAGGTIVALCDVDDNRRGRKGKDVRETYPKAAFYRDFRVMLEKEEKRLDAVTVSTPDHTHCHPSVMAMRMGKHVYCQKPLTHCIWEARLMAQTAKEFGVATQMGNQAHAGEPIRRAVELIRAGLMGKVSEVHTWTNRPIWPQGMKERPDPEPVPSGLDWDLWLGPAPMRPYNSAYCPFKWRGWWDFGTGALGDMGCHIMDMPYWSLDLKYPTTVEADSEGNTGESGPTAATVTYQFPAGEYCHELKYVWYDGKRMPPEDVIGDAGVPANQVASRFDLVMIGDKGKFFFKRNRTEWLITPKTILDDFEEPPQTIPRVPDEDAEWIEACKGGPAALSNFANAGPFTETVLLGNLAIRLGKKIQWDGPNMKATNAPEADVLIRREYRKGWEL